MRHAAIAMVVLAVASTQSRAASTQGAAAASGSATTIMPRDDAATVPSFAVFKSALLRAADRGDLNAIRKAMLPTLQVSFEPFKADEFIKREGLRDGLPWYALSDALRLGVAKSDERGEVIFIAPYVSAGAVPGEADDLAITGRGVALRERPNIDARIIARLSYEVVKSGPDNHVASGSVRDSPRDPSRWAQVVTPAGKIGYVFARFVYAPTALRFVFKRVGGAWKIVAIAEGD